MIHQGRPCNQMGRVPFPQHVSPLSSEYIRGVWATESSDTRRWIEVVMNLVSNSNSWMAIDKTNKEREPLAEVGDEMRPQHCRELSQIRPASPLNSNWAIIERDPCWNCNIWPQIYVLHELSPHVVWHELCFMLNCELSCFPPGCSVLLTHCKRKEKKKRWMEIYELRLSLWAECCY